MIVVCFFVVVFFNYALCVPERMMYFTTMQGAPASEIVITMSFLISDYSFHSHRCALHPCILHHCFSCIIVCSGDVAFCQMEIDEDATWTGCYFILQKEIND